MSGNLRDQETFAALPGLSDKKVTLAALLVVTALIVFMGLQWAGNRSLVQTLDSQIARIDSRMSQIEAKAQAPAPQAAPALDYKPVRINSEGAPTQGPTDAPITIVEYSDFQCIHCGTVRATLARVREVYGDKVRLVWKHNPLPMHKDSRLAHLASLAAHEQGKFWDYHDKLFTDPQKLTKEHLLQYARELGLDMQRFEKALETKRHVPQLEADLADAAAFQFTGAPAFMINSRSLIGAHPFENFAKTINLELEALKIPIPPEVEHLRIE